MSVGADRSRLTDIILLHDVRPDQTLILKNPWDTNAKFVENLNGWAGRENVKIVLCWRDLMHAWRSTIAALTRLRDSEMSYTSALYPTSQWQIIAFLLRLWRRFPSAGDLLVEFATGLAIYIGGKRFEALERACPAAELRLADGRGGQHVPIVRWPLLVRGIQTVSDRVARRISD